MDVERPIIVRRVYKKGGHHGGAWKVAFADFATAMMAFFLVLWLSANTSEEERQAISGYFQDPLALNEGAPSPIDLGGAPSIEPGTNLEPEATIDDFDERVVEDRADEIEKQRQQALLEKLIQQIDLSPTLRDFKDQIILDITPEGLRIQIVDKTGRPMFDSGSSELKFYSEDILFELAKPIFEAGNKVSIEGHTDASPFVGRDAFSNWELSAERANAARRALVVGGLGKERVARVVGLASSILYNTAEPLDPINRRISIILLNKQSQTEIERNAAGSSPLEEQEPLVEDSTDEQLDELGIDESLFDSEQVEQLDPEFVF